MHVHNIIRGAIDIMLELYYINKTTYNSTTDKDDNKLFFLSDTGEIYRGTENFTESCVIYDHDNEPTVKSKNKIYIDSTTLEGKMWNGFTWISLFSKSLNPDYNQNDSTASDYIKNRPFYETDTEIVKIPNKFISNPNIIINITLGDKKTNTTDTIYKCTISDSFENILNYINNGYNVIGVLTNPLEYHSSILKITSYNEKYIGFISVSYDAEICMYSSNSEFEYTVIEFSKKAICTITITDTDYGGSVDGYPIDLVYDDCYTKGMEIICRYGDEQYNLCNIDQSSNTLKFYNLVQNENGTLLAKFILISYDATTSTYSFTTNSVELASKSYVDEQFKDMDTVINYINSIVGEVTSSMTIINSIVGDI